MSRKVMYLVILWMEIPGAIIRTALSALFVSIVLTPLWVVFALLTAIIAVITHASIKATSGVGLVFLVIGGAIVFVGSMIGGWGNIVFSILSYLGLHGGHRETKWEFEARVMSITNEEVRFNHCMAHLASLAKDMKLKKWLKVYVIESPQQRAFTVGSTLFVTKGLLRGNELMGVMARELYYLQSGDARFVLALRRLVFPPAYLLARFAGHLAPGNLVFATIDAANNRYSGLLFYLGTYLGALAGGGYGILLMGPFIKRYLVKSLTRANIFATELGMGNPLADYYEPHNFFDSAVPYIGKPRIYGELLRDEIIRWMRGERWKI